MKKPMVVANSNAEHGVRLASRILESGGTAMDAVEEGIRVIEADPEIHSVGRGGWPNLLGQSELDASIMDGRGMRSGAVGALRGFLHPISVARRVMEELPHVFLVGSGAARFALDERMEMGEPLTEEAARNWRRWIDEHLTDTERQCFPYGSLSRLSWSTTDPIETSASAESENPHGTSGTTVFLAIDREGDVAGGVSTSGWAWKHPGRLGDSPVIGAGNYADNRYGAAACIGHGELAIRAASARSIVLYMKMGMGVGDACREAAMDLQSLKQNFKAQVTLYGVGRAGEYCVLGWGKKPERAHWYWEQGMKEPVERMTPKVVIP